jgi:hypothetical protein
VHTTLFKNNHQQANPNNPVVILRFAILSDSADRGAVLFELPAGTLKVTCFRHDYSSNSAHMTLENSTTL